MSVEIYNNFKLQKPAALDSRLNPADNFAALPNITSNFLYLGATVYVISEAADYKVTDVLGTWTWVKQEAVELVEGSINITNSETSIDMSLVSPVIAKCKSVTVYIIGTGTNADIYTIQNLPSTHDVELKVVYGKTLTLKHTNYNTASGGQIVLEDGFDFILHGRAVGNESISIRKNGTAAVQVGATQFVNSTEWTQSLLAIAIDDTLTSTSTTKALSANQGRILQNTKQDILTATSPLLLSNNVLSLIQSDWNLISISWTNTLSDTAANYSSIPNFLVYLTTVLKNPLSPSLGYIIDPLISQYTRYVDMQYDPNGLIFLNYGFWVLPAGADASNASHWVCVERPRPIAMDVLVNSQTVISGVASTNYFTPSFDTFSVTNTNNLLWDTAGHYAGEKYAFRMRRPELNATYDIELELNFYDTTSVGSGGTPPFYLQLVTTPGTPVPSDIHNLPVGATVIKTEYSTPSIFALDTTGSRKFTMRMKHRITDLTNVYYSFVVGRPSNSAWTNLNLSGGKLHITKVQ